MIIVKFAFWFAVVALAIGFVATQFLANRTETRFPPIGQFAEIDGVRMHYIESQPDTDKTPDDGALLPMVFIHGASGNARDLRGAFEEKLSGRATMLFVDRPGAGYSQRGDSSNADPAQQARLIAGLMDELGMEKAIIVGHSWGGAVALALALDDPEKVVGLALLAPATHTWPGAGVTAYYDLTNIPVLGWLFSETLAVPFGNLLYRKAVRSVFKPNSVPADYFDKSGSQLVLRPASFRNNAQDVGQLYGNVERLSKRYGEIDVPVVVLHGEEDETVSIDYHARRLVDQIDDAKLVALESAGHILSYSHTDRAIEEIEELNRTIAESN